MSKEIITRFPPSPTGYFHVGSARTALFNYLFAKANDGKMKLRIEDTDKERSKPEYTENILSSLDWLGIKHDGEIVTQSENVKKHTEILKKLIDEEKAYEAEKSKDGNGKVIRFKNPNKKVTFNDIIRGEITFDTTDLGDFVIAKNINEPLYHLAVVVDDIDMNVTHILRGEDHISNTPRQILIIEALGESIPQYGHIPLILGPDKSKLSKRHGAVSVEEYKEKYLPEAFVNYLALLGWNPGTDKEIFTMDELVKEFDIKNIQKGGAIFSEEKLKWVNARHLRNKNYDQKIELLENIETFEINSIPDYINKKIMTDVIFERVETLSDIREIIESGEIDYIFKEPELDPEMILWKKNPNKSETADKLNETIKLLENIVEDEFTNDIIKGAIWPFAEKVGKGDVLWPMRVTLSGKEKSPDPFILSELLGKEKTINRIENAIQKLRQG